MESKYNPHWYKLIKLLKSKEVIRTGLTLPYIFGAYKELGTNFKSIDELLRHIVESNPDKYPMLQSCNVICHYVILVKEKKECVKNYFSDYQLPSSSKDNLLFLSSNLGRNYKQICGKLEGLYANPISRGTYSWDNKSALWKEFTKDEKEQIRSLV